MQYSANHYTNPQKGGKRPLRVRKAFIQLKEALLSAPAFGLPDMTKAFTLYVHKSKNVAVGVLTQQMGSWPRPVSQQTIGSCGKGMAGVSKIDRSCGTDHQGSGQTYIGTGAHCQGTTCRPDIDGLQGKPLVHQC